MAQLRSARRHCLTKDARNELTYLLVNIAAVAATMRFLPKDSMGGSFSIFHAAMGSAYTLPSIIQTVYNFTFSPANSLEDLENHFALEKCFIPEMLHSTIIQKFCTARTNQFEQQTSINFLEFALGLSLYKPKPPINTDQETVLATIKESLFQKIDSFFLDYKNITPQDIWKIKNNVYSFVLSLLGEKNVLPRYIHLHGVGGIGKTYFVNNLYKWIEEPLPECTTFESFVVNSSEELEGNAQRPSIMLRILRNQLIKNKRGSIIFFDEASWLSDPSMISAAKRIFNGDQSTISTNYFGKDIEGSDLQLTVPPMLIFVAGNDEIKDPALKTRFDSIDFPKPKIERLIDYAKEIAAKNILITEKRTTSKSFNFENWLNESQADNFRDIASQIVPAILSQN